MTPTAEPLFDRTGWWDPACREFRTLRQTSAFRLALLRRWLPGEWNGRRVVDLGCGGGLLAVPLAAAGARVVGVDLAVDALREGSGRGVGDYLGVAGDLRSPPIDVTCADVVLLADVLEHVDDPAAVVARALAMLRPGGYLFVNTIHRTLRSRILAITLGEGLGFVPRGTHRWQMFVTPDELDRMSERAGAERVQRIGETPRIWRTLRTGTVELRETPCLAVCYAALYRRVA